MKVMEKDKIQIIPSGLEKYLGTGNMVLPSEDTIREELRKVPHGKLTTIPRIRASIADQLGVANACPKTSLKVLRTMMEEKDSGAYKVLNGKGELVAKDTKFQAELLREEGFEIDSSKKKPKVKDFKFHL